jgi:hypothetical protein
LTNCNRAWIRPLKLFALALLSIPVPVLAQSSGQSQEKSGARDQSHSATDKSRRGPFTFEFHGQMRARYEHDGGFTLKGYEPAGHDQLLLERVRLDLSMRIRENVRFFLQLQDAHAFLTRFDDKDFPKSNPLEDTLDVRQLYCEWLHIGGSAVGFKALEIRRSLEDRGSGGDSHHCPQTRWGLR